MSHVRPPGGDWQVRTAEVRDPARVIGAPARVDNTRTAGCVGWLTFR
jgi:hypothetical protein